MKTLTVVFTYEKNLPYFRACLDHWRKSVQISLSTGTTKSYDLLIIDFSKRECKELSKEGKRDYQYYHIPEGGFGRNFNAARDVIFFHNYDYFISINDDAAISDIFITEGMKFLKEHPEAGFVGGVPNRGGWLLPLDMLEIPDPIDKFVESNPMDRLWWEFSACIYTREAIEKVGKWDEFFDKNGGCCGDNDYAIRLFKSGFRMYRNGRMRFFHAKGVSQAALYRMPVPNRPDPMKDRNYQHLKNKWGITSQSKTVDDLFEYPFNITPEQGKND